MYSRDKRKREEKQSERTVTVRINAFLLEGGNEADDSTLHRGRRMADNTAIRALARDTKMGEVPACTRAGYQERNNNHKSNKTRKMGNHTTLRCVLYGTYDDST